MFLLYNQYNFTKKGTGGMDERMSVKKQCNKFKGIADPYWNHTDNNSMEDFHLLSFRFV